MRLLILIATSWTLSASAAAPENLTLQQAIQTALSNSPEVQQLEEQLNSAKAKAGLTLAPTEPTLALTYNDLTQRFNTSTSASHSLVFTQPIGFPGRAFMNYNMMDQQAEAVNAQLEAMRLQVSLNVKSAYFALQLARRNLSLNNDTKLAYERIVEVAKRRYEAGATAQVDYLNAQVALLSNQNDLADLQNSEKTAVATLNIALHQPVETELRVEPIKMTYLPAVAFEPSLEKMLAHRHEIRAARAQEKAAAQAYRLAWMQLVPDFQVSLGVTNYDYPLASPYNAQPGYPTQTYTAGVSITLPLWGLFNEREVIRGAARDHGAAERALDVLYNQSKVALQTAIETINASEKKIRNFEQHILPLADQSLHLAMIAYSSGKVDFQTLADTATARRQAFLNYSQTVVTYLTTYATYGQLIGEDFQ